MEKFRAKLSKKATQSVSSIPAYAKTTSSSLGRNFENLTEHLEVI